MLKKKWRLQGGGVEVTQTTGNTTNSITTGEDHPGDLEIAFEDKGQIAT